MDRSALAATILKTDGILLLVVAMIHFAATPHVFALFRVSRPRGVRTNKASLHAEFHSRWYASASNRTQHRLLRQFLQVG
jgi:hypothetical protein